MLSLRDIYNKDRQTRREQTAGSRRRHGYPVALALCLALFFDDISLDFLAAILAVLSILAGFGFNVLVFLTTNKAIPVPSNAKIERKLKIYRVNKLGKEIFYNISYFNTVALICISVALAVAIRHAINVGFYVNLWKENYHLTNFGRMAKDSIFFIIPKIFAAVLYCLLIEALLSFIFLIRRSTYYFEQKIALADRDPD